MPRYLFKTALMIMLLLAPLTHLNKSSIVWASSDIVQFSDPLLRDRYYQLVQELRCPKCQNQNLADSNAPISKDMKAQIHSMLEAQKTDDQIKQHLVSRYSEFVLYRPEVNANTWFLWFAPLCIVLFGAVVIWRYAFSGNPAKSDAKTYAADLSAKQQQKLSKLLGEDEQS
ncbi:MAG: cytochrome c-type biogenesis protein CcmH [Porticoccaceae bacterium]|nr:cytochrome c-type biogenesis protein CcmH [Porticoccaceae bacterium]